MKFLMVTEPDDMHALLVKRGLEEAGHSVRLLFTADHPTKQKNAVFIDNNSYHWISTDSCHSIAENSYEVVWWRRVGKPYIPRDLIHPNDYQIVNRENTLFYESLTNNLAPDAWWVNSKAAAHKANSKLFQLRMATACGLNIPTTLCANDPDEIRDFITLYEKWGVIYKPLSTNLWCENKEVKMTYTSKISSAQLPKDDLLQFAPGMYQKEIKKRYELRVTCFGNYLVAAKLHSQSHSLGKVDWRKIPDGELSIEPYPLPRSLEAKIQEFMKKMGLVFGALDFIATEEGEYYFLEVNEQGQFLWIEDYNPEFKMLDMFINFLIKKSVHYTWDAQKSQHHMSDYLQGIELLIENNLEHHVNANQSSIYFQQ